MKNSILFSILLLGSVPSYSQQRQVEKALEDKYMKEHGNAGMSKLQGFMDNMNNAVTRPAYSFPLSVTMRVTDYNKGVKKDATDMLYHINAAEQAFAVDGGNSKGSNKDMFVVYDMKNNSMIMLDEKKKSYMAMNMNAFMSAEMQANRGKHTENKTKCNKTGKTQSIKGYPCQEYVCIDPDKPDTKMEVWITNKIPMQFSAAAKGQPWAGYYAGMGDMSGMMMDGKMYKNNELDGTMEVLELDEKSTKSVTLSYYKKSDMFSR